VLPYPVGLNLNLRGDVCAGIVVYVHPALVTSWSSDEPWGTYPMNVSRTNFLHPRGTFGSHKVLETFKSNTSRGLRVPLCVLKLIRYSFILKTGT
jgi:hypothetical protein